MDYCNPQRQKQPKSWLRCKQDIAFKDAEFQNNFHPSSKETNEQWNDQLWATDGKQKKNSEKVYHLDKQPLNNQWWVNFLFSLPKHLAKLTDVTPMTLLRSLLSKQMFFHNGPILSKKRITKEDFSIYYSLLILQPARFFHASFLLKRFYICIHTIRVLLS